MKTKRKVWRHNADTIEWHATDERIIFVKKLLGWNKGPMTTREEYFAKIFKETYYKTQEKWPIQAFTLDDSYALSIVAFMKVKNLDYKQVTAACRNAHRDESKTWSKKSMRDANRKPMPELPHENDGIDAIILGDLITAIGREDESYAHYLRLICFEGMTIGQAREEMDFSRKEYEAFRVGLIGSFFRVNNGMTGIKIGVIKDV